MPIKTIAIFPNVSKPQAPEVLRRILQFYQDKDVQLMLPVDESRYFDLEYLGVPDIEKKAADIALSIGGDGTLLGVCRRYGAMAVPVCGINIGTLGRSCKSCLMAITALNIGCCSRALPNRTAKNASWVMPSTMWSSPRAVWRVCCIWGYPSTIPI